MDQDKVSMKSITFKKLEEYANIASVQCSLTNGLVSEVFEQEDGRYIDKLTIQFYKKISIRAVEAAEDAEEDCVASKICFLDGDDNLRYSYDPDKLDDGTEKEIIIKQNQ